MTGAQLWPMVVGAAFGMLTTGALTFLTIYQRLARLEEFAELVKSGRLRLEVA